MKIINIDKFREKFEVRNYEADAHAWDIHVRDVPEEIENFISHELTRAYEEGFEAASVQKRVAQKMYLEEVEKNKKTHEKN